MPEYGAGDYGAGGYSGYVTGLDPGDYGAGTYGAGRYGMSTPAMSGYGSGNYGAGPYGGATLQPEPTAATSHPGRPMIFPPEWVDTRTPLEEEELTLILAALT